MLTIPFLSVDYEVYDCFLIVIYSKNVDKKVFYAILMCYKQFLQLFYFAKAYLRLGVYLPVGAHRTNIKHSVTLCAQYFERVRCGRLVDIADSDILYPHSVKRQKI